MFSVLIEFILIGIAIYVVAGFVFAMTFISKGIHRIDEGAHGTGWGFKLIIIPGTIVFWPLLLKKWVEQNRRTAIKPE